VALEPSAAAWRWGFKMPGTQKFIIPTGFETQQAKIASRQTMQKALRERALGGTPTNATSWTQVLAPIIDGLLARRMGKGIEKDTESLRSDMLGQYQTTMTEAQKDFENTGDLPGQLSRSEFVAKWGNNPFAAPLVESVGKGMDSVQTAGASWAPKKMSVRNGPAGTEQIATVLMNNRGQARPADPGVQLPPEMTEINGVAMNKDRWQEGQILPPNYNQNIVLNPQGMPIPNTAAISGKRVAAGFESIPAMSPPPVGNYLPQDGLQAPMPTAPSIPPVPSGPKQILDHRELDGKHYYLINGQWYDNPEGL